MLAHAILCKFYVGALCHFYARHKTEFYAEHKIYINLALCGRYAGFMHRFFPVKSADAFYASFMSLIKIFMGLYGPHNNGEVER